MRERALLLTVAARRLLCSPGASGGSSHAQHPTAAACVEQDPWSWFAALALSLPSHLPTPSPLLCLLPSSLDAVDAEQAGQEQGWSYCFSYEVRHLHSIISNQMPRSASSEIQSTAKSSCINDTLSKKYILKVQCNLFFLHKQFLQQWLTPPPVAIPGGGAVRTAAAFPFTAIYKVKYKNYGKEEKEEEKNTLLCSSLQNYTHRDLYSFTLVSVWHRRIITCISSEQGPRRKGDKYFRTVN